MNPYLPPDKQNIDDIPLDDEDDCDTDRPMTEGEAAIARGLGAYLAQSELEEDCTHEEYHMGRCVACSASQIDGARLKRREPIFAKYPVRDFVQIKLKTKSQSASPMVVSITTDTSMPQVPSKNGIIRVGSVTQKFAIGCIFALLLIAILYAANKGLRRQELVACKQLSTYSQRYSGFYLTKSEKQMCDSYGITIYAPVK